MTKNEIQKNEIAEQPSLSASAGTENRVVSIDRMRGICIFIMVGSVLLGMFGDTFAAIKGLYKHGAEGWQLVAGNASFVNGGYSGIALADIFRAFVYFCDRSYSLLEL